MSVVVFMFCRLILAASLNVRKYVRIVFFQPTVISRRWPDFFPVNVEKIVWVDVAPVPFEPGDPYRLAHARVLGSDIPKNFAGVRVRDLVKVLGTGAGYLFQDIPGHIRRTGEGERPYYCSASVPYRVQCRRSEQLFATLNLPFLLIVERNVEEAGVKVGSKSFFAVLATSVVPNLPRLEMPTEILHEKLVVAKIEGPSLRKGPIFVRKGDEERRIVKRGFVVDTGGPVQGAGASAILALATRVIYR